MLVFYLFTLSKPILPKGSIVFHFYASLRNLWNPPNPTQNWATLAVEYAARISLSMATLGYPQTLTVCRYTAPSCNPIPPT